MQKQCSLFADVSHLSEKIHHVLRAGTTLPTIFATARIEQAGIDRTALPGEPTRTEEATTRQARTNRSDLPSTIGGIAIRNHGTNLFRLAFARLPIH